MLAPLLPRVLITDDGLPPPAVSGLTTGTLFHDVDLEILVERAAQARLAVAVDIDTVRGLKTDEAAVHFVVHELRASVVISRRPVLAQLAAGLGAIGLQSALAFDSTGLRRSMPADGADPRVGTVITPGLVVPHLSEDEMDQLPRPILAHGLIVRPSDALACLARADAIVLRSDAARFLASRLAQPEREDHNFLTSIAIEE